MKSNLRTARVRRGDEPCQAIYATLPPGADLDEAALAARANSTAPLQAAVYRGADKKDFRD
jgi:hypothetical protein